MYQLKLTNHLDGGYMATECIILPTLVLRKRMQQEEDHEVVLAEGGKPPNKNKTDLRTLTLPTQFLLTSAKKKKKKESWTHFPPNR